MINKLYPLRWNQTLINLTFNIAINVKNFYNFGQLIVWSSDPAFNSRWTVKKKSYKIIIDWPFLNLIFFHLLIFETTPCLNHPTLHIDRWYIGFRNNLKPSLDEITLGLKIWRGLRGKRYASLINFATSMIFFLIIHSRDMYICIYSCVHTRSTFFLLANYFFFFQKFQRNSFLLSGKNKVIKLLFQSNLVLVGNSPW